MTREVKSYISLPPSVIILFIEMHNYVLGYLLYVGSWDICCWEVLTVQYLTNSTSLNHYIYYTVVLSFWNSRALLCDSWLLPEWSLVGQVQAIVINEPPTIPTRVELNVRIQTASVLLWLTCYKIWEEIFLYYNHATYYIVQFTSYTTERDIQNYDLYIIDLTVDLVLVIMCVW